MIASVPLALLMLLPQTPPPPPQTPIPPKPVVTTGVPTRPQGEYEFITELGAFLIVVKSDKTASFDAAMVKLKQVIATSTDKDRKAQAIGWRVLKSSEEATDGAVTYLWLIDPVTKTASYDPMEIIRQLSPVDVQPVFDQLQASVVSITRLGLRELLKIGGS